MYPAVMICEAGYYSNVYQNGCLVTQGQAKVFRSLDFSVLGCEDNVESAPIIRAKDEIGLTCVQ